MRQRFWIETWSGQILVAAMVLAALAVGLCMFDRHEHGAADGCVAFDLCFGLAIMSIAVAMLKLFAVHALALDAPSLFDAVPLHRVDPPPKFASLA